jgi:PAS domain-containing protein
VASYGSPASTDGREATIIIFRDITERKRMREELRQSEKKHRQLIESLNEGIWVIDKDGNTTFVNHYLAKMFGYTQEENE